mmetsp:Transcript_16599/g.42623  ORF Transcript_16599/g.42623 Transcript_16599/m.42623 type:complete len:450 (-) Transcript_16599:429-1778(-)
MYDDEWSPPSSSSSSSSKPTDMAESPPPSRALAAACAASTRVVASSSSSSSSESEPRVGALPPSGRDCNCSQRVSAPPGAMKAFHSGHSISMSSRTSGSRCAADSRHAPMCIANAWQHGRIFPFGARRTGPSSSLSPGGCGGGAYSLMSSTIRLAARASQTSALRTIVISSVDPDVYAAAHSRMAAHRMCSALHECGESKRSVTIGSRPSSISGPMREARSDLRHSSSSRSTLHRCAPRGRYAGVSPSAKNRANRAGSGAGAATEAKNRSMSVSSWERRTSDTGEGVAASRSLVSSCSTTSSAGRLGVSSALRQTRTSRAQRSRPDEPSSRHSGGSVDAPRRAQSNCEALAATSGSSWPSASKAAGISVGCGSHDCAARSSRGDVEQAGPPGSEGGGSPMHRAMSSWRMASDPRCVMSWPISVASSGIPWHCSKHSGLCRCSDFRILHT